MALKISHGLYIFILLFIAAILNKYFVEIGLGNFYDSLNLPVGTTDNFYFILAWRFFYSVLFVSFYIVLQSKSDIEAYSDANALFIMQLFLQVLWCFSFFYLEQISVAAIIIIFYDAMVWLMLIAFKKINFWAYILLIPYAAWLLFATYMNISIVFLN